MSQPDSTEIQISFLSRFNVYTVLLGLALIAILVSIALLALELQRYDWDFDARSAARPIPTFGEVVAAHGGAAGGIDLA